MASTRTRHSSRRSGATRCSPTIKLIAEPWDIGPGGYRVGAFPPEWSEWNDTFRRTLRRYWAGEGGLIGESGERA